MVIKFWNKRMPYPQISKDRNRHTDNAQTTNPLSHRMPA